MSAILAAFLLAQTKEPALFSPPAFSTFDGKTYAGIELEVAMARDVLKIYKAFKGAFRGGAMLLNDGKLDGVKSETLNDRAGSKSKIIGFRLTYFGLGEDPEKFIKDLGQPTPFYAMKRYEDWRVLVWPEKGVALRTSMDSRGERVREAILTTPTRLQRGLTLLTKTDDGVQAYKDPFADQPRELEFGQVTVRFNVRGLKIQDEDGQRDEYERELRRLRAGNFLRYRRGTGGTATLDVNCDYNPTRGGRLTVTARVQGRTVYGEVREEASLDRDIAKPKNGAQPPVYVRFQNLADEVLRDLEDQLEQTIRRQGPPPLEVWQGRNWMEFLTEACPG
ncbi:MAG: hypothetical protein JST35_01410 [Armatimonadetes bacterium]|nr:hypothetical protein [Armatimonadota bacterium]